MRIFRKTAKLAINFRRPWLARTASVRFFVQLCCFNCQTFKFGSHPLTDTKTLRLRLVFIYYVRRKVGNTKLNFITSSDNCCSYGRIANIQMPARFNAHFYCSLNLLKCTTFIIRFTCTYLCYAFVSFFDFSQRVSFPTCVFICRPASQNHNNNSNNMQRLHS